MNRNIKNILKEKMLVLNTVKMGIRTNILRSIKQNNNITNNINIYSTTILQKTISKDKNSQSSKQHKICVFTGKRGGIISTFNMSRWTVKKLLLLNKLTNIKKKNW